MMQELVERLQQMAEGAVNCIHTAIPGSIVDFDPATCLATVSPKMKYTKPAGSNHSTSGCMAGRLPPTCGTT